MDRAVFVIEGFEEHIQFVLFLSPKLSLYECNFYVKFAFDTVNAISLPFAT